MNKLHTEDKPPAKKEPEKKEAPVEGAREEARAGEERPARAACSAEEMSLKCGIVGLPNVGKSTLFNALTKAGIAAENYPFCTIEPNVGIVEVPDPRLDALADDRASRRRSCRRSSSSSTSPAWSPARRRARASATSSSPTSARPTRSRTWCAASRTTNVVHVAGKVDPVVRHRDDQHRARARRPRRRSRSQLAKHAKVAQTGGDKEAQRAGRGADEGAAPRSTQAGRRAASSSAEGRAGGAAAALPADDEAGDVRRQRRRERLREQPAARRGCSAYAAKEGAPVVADLRRDRSEIADMSTTRTSSCSSPTWAWTSRA